MSSALLFFSRQLHAAKDLESVMEEARHTIRAATRYERVWMVLTTSEGYLEMVGYMLPNAELARQRMAALQVEGDPYLRMLDTAVDPLVVPDLREHPLADQQQVELFGFRTQILMPMVHLAERRGVMVVGTFAEHGVVEPTQEEFDFIAQVASLVSVVTGRISAEQKQSAMEKRMQSTQRFETLGRLVGEVSHDINNILMCIDGCVEQAKDMVGPRHIANEPLLEVLEASARTAKLTQQLLAYSKGELPLTKHLNVSNVVQNLSRMLVRLMPDDVDLVLDTEQSVRADMDQGQLEQLVMNLILNARDAMPEGGVLRLVTELYALTSEDAHEHHLEVTSPFLRLSVIDVGEGMSEEVRSRMFEPFFSTKGEHKGTGLGMSVVENVVRTHGGFFKVHSVLSEGTSIEVYLPALGKQSVGDSAVDVH